MTPWHVLGISPTQEARDIKRAYAAALKKTHPEDDPTGFQALRTAYEKALALAAQAPRDAGDFNRLAEHVDVRTETVGASSAPASPRSDVAPPLTDPTAVPRADSGLVDSPNPHLAALALCDELLALPEDARRKALSAAMRRPGWEQLDFQAALEEQLLWQLDQGLERHAPLVGVIAQQYEWERKRQRVGRSHPLLERIAARLEAKRWIAHVSARGTALERQALDLLLKAPDERAFRRFGRSIRRLSVMRQLFEVLQTAQRPVLQFEVNSDSADWWHRRLASWPATVDHTAASVVLGFFVGCFAAFGIHVHLDVTGTSPLRQGISVATILVAIVLFVGGECLYRWWRRGIAHGRFPPLEHVRDHWARDPARRWTLFAIAGISLTLNLLSVFSAPLAWATVAGVALLLFWYGPRVAFSILLVMALPLWMMLAFGIGGLLSAVPRLEAMFPEPPVIAFPYLLAALLFVPLARGWSRVMAKFFEGPPKEPLKAAFYLTVFLVFGGGILVALVSQQFERPAHTVIVDQKARTSPQHVLRPLSEIWEEQERLKQRFEVVDTRFHAVKPASKGARIELWYLVAGSGVVEQVRLVKSSFGDADFNLAMIEALKTFTFKRVGHYSSSAFVLTYGQVDGTAGSDLRQDSALLSGPAPKTTPAPPEPPKEFSLVRRPLTDVRRNPPDAQKLTALYRQFYPTTDADPKASVTLGFIVEADGTVSDVKVEQSTFKNPPFEKALANELESLRYPKNAKYEPTPFTWKFDGVTPNMGRPPRPVESLQAEFRTQDAQIDDVFRKFYPPDRPVPEGAGIGLEFIVERDGSVSKAAVTQSTFNDPAFHDAMLEAVRSTRFPPAPGNSATRFTLAYGTAKSAAGNAQPATGVSSAPSQ